MDRQVISELQTMTRFYSKAVKNINKKLQIIKVKYLSMQKRRFLRKKHKSSGCVRDLNRTGISIEDKNKEWVFFSSFHSHELNALVSLLLMEIRKRYKFGSECNKISCLYRCFSDKKEESPNCTNVEWS
jgi:hypothetical protein